jgi:hypothetical protein
VTPAQAERSPSAALAELNGLLRCASPVEAARGEPALLGSSTGSIRSVVRDACLFGLVGVWNCGVRCYASCVAAMHLLECRGDRVIGLRR